MPKISVIMPVYNGEQFIGEAIDSLLSQTFQDWELVVVDDGSTDGTSQILRQYADNRIRVIHQENCGEASARNTGLDHINGEYMAFLDADDLYLPNALSDMNSYLDQHPQYGSIFSDGYICDHQGNMLMRLTDIRPGIFTGKVLEPLVVYSSVITVPTCTMTRVSKIRDYALRFDEKDKLLGTDWDFWIRLAVHVEFGYLDKLTCKYRIHESNITRVYGSEKRKKDYVYCRMKVLNSDWFNEMSIDTRNTFFIDLLTNALSADIESQKRVLKNKRFSELQLYVQSDIWRMVGIDALQAGHSLEVVRECLLESNRLNPNDNKSRFILRSLKIGNTFTLVWVRLWRWLLRIYSKLTSSGFSRTKHLQKMLGIQ